MEIQSEKKSRNVILDYILLSPLFLSAYILFKYPFEFYISYIPIILSLPFFSLRYGLPKVVVTGLLVLFFLGAIKVIEGENEMPSLIKIWLNILISSVYFFHLIIFFEKDIKYIFKLYMNLAFIVSAIGLFQVASHLVGFAPGANLFYIFNKWGINEGGIGIRLNSIFSEPSYFGASIAPAFLISLHNLIRGERLFLNRLKSSTVILAYILTFSTVSIIGIFITILLFLINYGLIKYSITVFSILFIGAFTAYNNIDEFKVRIDGIYDLWFGEVSSATQVHGSSFVLYNNYSVTKSNIKENPLIGSGLGSYEHAYAKYSLAEKFGGIYDFNSKDANSMLLRLTSETGLLGLVLTLFFLVRFFVKRDSEQPENLSWLLSSSVLLIIILQLARQGNYTFSGFILYPWLYYFIWKKSSAEEEENEVDQYVDD